LSVIISDINIGVGIKEFLNSIIVAVEILSEIPDLMLGVQLLICNESNIMQECRIIYLIRYHL